MSSRRPVVLLSSFAIVAAIGFGLAAVFDDQKGWNDPGQAVANIAWIVMWLAVLGLVVTAGALLVRANRNRRTAV